MNARLLLAVDASTVDLTDDDRHFAEACARHGFNPQPLPWGATVPVGALVVIRSTWDYFERPAQFAAWLDHLDAQGAVVHNPTRLLRWNMSKRYLITLAAAGVPTVPTELVEQGAKPSLDAICARRGWVEVVVKPAVGGTARRCEHSVDVGHRELQRHLEALTVDEDAIVQPYLPTITTTGETSIIAIAGQARLAVVKRPAPGDWRVHAEFGGTVAPHGNGCGLRPWRAHASAKWRSSSVRSTVEASTASSSRAFTLPFYRRLQLDRLDSPRAQ